MLAEKENSARGSNQATYTPVQYTPPPRLPTLHATADGIVSVDLPYETGKRAMDKTNLILNLLPSDDEIKALRNDFTDRLKYKKLDNDVREKILAGINAIRSIIDRQTDILYIAPISAEIPSKVLVQIAFSLIAIRKKKIK